jgi:eukaryotic-like serine/threonine-protein kinase
MKLTLSVVAGVHTGSVYTFEGHDTFLVGRTRDAHFRLSYDDPYFSRRHFLVEVNPPRCRILDLNSRNGVEVNGKRVKATELVDGDEIKAGHTRFRVAVVPDPPPEQQPTPVELQPDETHAPSGRVSVDMFYQETLPPELLPELELVDESERIPGYKLADEVGRGAMGVVYKATRLSDGATVAIKTIIPAAGTTAKQADRFVREAKILSQLKHPHVVQFLDVGQAADETLFLVMEYVDGPTAEAVRRDYGPMDIKTACRVMAQVLAGLGHAHGKGFVHRDVKPGNVLIGRTPSGGRVAKLADFGLARVHDDANLSGLTMQGDVGGTPAFIAPEQISHYRDVSPQADQYAAAATLYTLLTNRFIFDLPREVTGQLIHIMTEKPIPIRDRRPDVPEGLAEVIHRALEREPDERFPDVLKFRSALAAFAV